MIDDFTGETTRCERSHGIGGTAKQERVTLSQSTLRKFKHVISYEILIFNLTWDFQVVSCVGGVGKTTLAFKYVHRYVKSYSDGVFYFNTESHLSFLFWLRENVSSLFRTTSKIILSDPLL